MSEPGAIDVRQVRVDTPGCHDHIYLDNAGAALPPRQVVDAQVEYLRREAMVGGYRLADARRQELDDTYDALAELLSARPDEIALTSNATESWQLAFNSFPFRDGDRILTGEAEYASNYLEFLRLAQDVEVSIDVIPSDEHGRTDPSALAAMLDERVRLIALTHVPTNGGLINPAAAIGRIARSAGVPYLLDACQSVGQLPLDVDELGCDFLSGTGRKFLRGPRGTGFLYARRSILERTMPPVVDLRGAVWTTRRSMEIDATARRYENWEFNYAAVRGLGVAVRYALDIGLDPIRRRVGWLADELRARLAETPKVTVHDLGVERAGIVTCAHADIEAAELSRRLAGAGIVSSYTTPFSTRIDAERRGLPDLLRLSPHYYNTVDELDATAAAIAAA